MIVEICEVTVLWWAGFPIFGESCSLHLQGEVTDKKFHPLIYNTEPWGSREFSVLKIYVVQCWVYSET